MKIAAVLGVMCAMTLATAAFAQETADPVVSSAREIVTRQSGYIERAAEAMPADKYSYKPTAEQMSFGKVISHIVAANYHVCSMLTDKPAPQGSALAETTPKEQLVAALTSSLDYCNAAFAQLKDSQLGDTISFLGGAKKPRARAMLEVVADLEDHYSQMAMYMRLNGIIPPSAAPKK